MLMNDENCENERGIDKYLPRVLIESIDWERKKLCLSVSIIFIVVGSYLNGDGNEDNFFDFKDLMILSLKN